MNAIEFIARHLQEAPAPLEPCDAVCAFTGERLTRGVPIKKAIAKTFTDRQYLRYQSKYISAQAYRVMHRISYQGRDDFELRKFSFLATEKNLQIIQRSQCLNLLLNPPDPPFILSITESNKKHRAFKSRICQSQDIIPIAADAGLINFPVEHAREIYPTVQAWYSILPGKTKTTQQPTWFTKRDILQGNVNVKRINNYGIFNYFKENDQLERFRGAPWFNLLIFTLNKGDEHATH